MGIFADQVQLFQEYEVELQFRRWVMGGIPKDQAIVEAWLRSKWKGASDEEIRQSVLRSLREEGIEIADSASFEEMEAASKNVARQKNTNGFRHDEHGLYLEGRNIKAALKEGTSVLYAAERMGPTRKGAKSYLSERVFVHGEYEEDKVHLGMMEPSGLHLFIGHTTGPQGRQSNLTYFEYCDRPVLRFRLKVLRDEFPKKCWPELWTYLEENGIGALRSQDFGRFDVLRFDPVDSFTRAGRTPATVR